jgi:2-C-methyl-D-erythritol 4-phosphate cytidylyltransferase/2-C-methyl-D-erythritol 2,4-cyclodiphosphate synthase
MGGVPKQFRSLGGRPLWHWSAKVAEGLYSDGLIDELVVVLPEGTGEEAVDLSCPVTYASGGCERTDSVINGLEASSSEYVMIHDAARPFLDPRICLDLIGAVSGERGAIPLLPSVDSLKGVDGDVTSVIPRDAVFRTQTPQAFRRKPLLEILRASGSATDEASVWLASSKELARVPGDEKNFKITTDFDWHIARSLVDSSREIRTGYGYDLHELVPGRKLIIGGLDIPSPLGLLGHSDADVLCHAISDALLGAAGRDDIGTLFPASDERYRDIDSTLILERALEIISSDGWGIEWIDVVLIAQVPRLGSIMRKVLENLGRKFTVHKLMDKMNIKVKSGEYVGGAGRGEYMACHAVATIKRF